MVKATVPAKVSKRKAREERLLDFDALARFANLGDKPDDWAHFRQMWPKFFPDDMTEWIYINARVWWELPNLPDKRPDNYREILRGWGRSPDTPISIEAWTSGVREWKRRMPRLRPPLLFYRNLLGRVWRREDPNGSSLSVLLGFDDAWAPVLEEGEIAKEEPLRIKEEDGTIFEMEAPVDYGMLFMYKAPERPEIHTDKLGLTYMDPQTATSYGLPIGAPVVDGKTGAINWHFNCHFQRDVYHLMQERWRAKVCPQCRKYFVADKVARRYCSTDCYGERKRKESLYRYHRIEKERRQSRATQTRVRKRKS
jgi:hypothetical protein